MLRFSKMNVEMMYKKGTLVLEKQTGYETSLSVETSLVLHTQTHLNTHNKYRQQQKQKNKKDERRKESWLFSVAGGFRGTEITRVSALSNGSMFGETSGA